LRFEEAAEAWFGGGGVCGGWGEARGPGWRESMEGRADVDVGVFMPEWVRRRGVEGSRGEAMVDMAGGIWGGRSSFGDGDGE